MSLLTVNLKHFYQKRSYWFVGLVFAAIAFSVSGAISRGIARDRLNAFCAPGMWMLLLGIIIASLPIEVLTRSFSYCLPGHRGIPRGFLFWIGLPLSFLWGLVFLFYPGLSFIEAIPFCLSAFSAFTIFYWIGVWVVFRFRNWQFVFALFPLMLGDKPLNISGFIVHHIVGSPLLVILLGGAINFIAWRYLGRSDLARRYCGKLWMGTFDAWNREKLAKFRLAQLAERDQKRPRSMRMSDGVEGFFISRIRQAEFGSLRQYIWGSLYRTYGIMFSQRKQDWIRSLMIMLPVLCFLCYMPGGGKNIIFLMPGLMVVHMSLWVHSSLLIGGGRRERFWSGLTLAVTTGVFITVVVTLVALLSQVMEGIMPPLNYSGHKWDFNALTVTFSIIPLLMVPIVLAIGLVFHKNPMLAMIFALVLFQSIFVFIVVDKLTILGWRMHFGPTTIILILLCAWWVFIAVLRYITMRCCLVRQTK